jgi:hypothetical protein
MSKSISIDEAKQVMNAAFLPLLCELVEEDRGRRAKFIICDVEGGERFTYQGLLMGQICDLRRLLSLIADARERLIEDGVELEEWVPPAMEG